MARVPTVSPETRAEANLDGPTLERLRALGYVDGGEEESFRGYSRMLPRQFESPARRPAYVTGEQYDAAVDEGVLQVRDAPLSTFSIDIDTASYANVRRFLTSGSLPPAGAVRIEELINYFSYTYDQPKGDKPFSVTTELARAPWNSDHQLLMVGLQGAEVEQNEIPSRNLVFLLDVSGSMASGDKLPLVKRAFTDFVTTLTAEDYVSIVVYAGASGCVLPPTRGDKTSEILGAIDRLHVGGSTNGGAGIRLAYDLAKKHFKSDGVNRVILATDGDFGVGTVNRSELVELIETERASGVFLSVLGVGTGNIKDATIEEIADKGNGNYSYLDSIAEARKVLIEEANGTLLTIAKDVKIQIEFNPVHVAGYRLIGYENRRLAAEDFNDDRKDAGEIGAGHSVTALYEIVPAGSSVPGKSIDPLRYQRPSQPSEEPLQRDRVSSDELATVKLRYKAPDTNVSRLLTRHVTASPVEDHARSENLRFASAVATFGMVLREWLPCFRCAAFSRPRRPEKARTHRSRDPESHRSSNAVRQPSISPNALRRYVLVSSGCAV